jgi:hypothetical protein
LEKEYGAEVRVLSEFEWGTLRGPVEDNVLGRMYHACEELRNMLFNSAKVLEEMPGGSHVWTRS